MRKIIGQLKWAKIKPPRLGPATPPNATKVLTTPIARPRSASAKVEVTIPYVFAKVIAPPSAWIIRANIKKLKPRLIPAIKEPKTNVPVPHLKIRCLPMRSPSLPKGNSSALKTIKYSETVHSI